MAKPTSQQCHAMVSYYISKYRAVNGSDPVVNRNKGKYAFEGILWDLTTDEAKALVDFFVVHYDRDFDWFAYNYDKVGQAMREYEEEQKLIAVRRDATALALQRWNKRKEELGARRGRTDRSQGD